MVFWLLVVHIILGQCADANWEGVRLHECGVIEQIGKVSDMTHGVLASFDKLLDTINKLREKMPAIPVKDAAMAAVFVVIWKHTEDYAEVVKASHAKSVASVQRFLEPLIKTLDLEVKTLSHTLLGEATVPNFFSIMMRLGEASESTKQHLDQEWSHYYEESNRTDTYRDVKTAWGLISSVAACSTMNPIWCFSLGVPVYNYFMDPAPVELTGWKYDLIRANSNLEVLNQKLTNFVREWIDVTEDSCLQIKKNYEKKCHSNRACRTAVEEVNCYPYEVVPLSLGIETLGGIMDVMVVKGHPVPFKVTKNFTTIKDDQQTINIRLFEGERPLIKHNHLLGEFEVVGLHAKSQRGHPVEVTIEVTYEGELEVEAKEGKMGRSGKITISKQTRLAPGKMKEMKDDAHKYSSHDASELERVKRELLREKFFIDYIGDLFRGGGSNANVLASSEQI